MFGQYTNRRSSLNTPTPTINLGDSLQKTSFSCRPPRSFSGYEACFTLGNDHVQQNVNRADRIQLNRMWSNTRNQVEANQ
ncbi:hypothetical protein P5673_019156 [Acropora cervicornis]|uniref:Uncharacterized protein n=1 Tax=Acropora cervicornis TaxID=6130 RepID=A0AAD9QBT8_ACRCE|nr:hypothetical protein P5673_019156 [Acropora cervicornis]